MGKEWEWSGNVAGFGGKRVGRCGNGVGNVQHTKPVNQKVGIGVLIESANEHKPYTQWLGKQ